MQSCGIFETRDSETPTQSRSTFIQPTLPEYVIVNMSFAIAEKNLDNYMRCFVDSNFSPRRYKYFPDAVSQTSYPVFLNWQLTQERNYFSNLISFTTPTAPSNFFADEVTYNTAIDSAVVDMNYILIFDHNRKGITTQAKGKLRFILGTDIRGQWSIHTWYDFIDTNNDTTWSVIKANFVN